MRRVSLVVSHMDDHQTFHALNDRGWRVDPIARTLVIGKGTRRTILPLDNVRMIEFVEREVPDPEPAPDGLPITVTLHTKDPVSFGPGERVTGATLHATATTNTDVVFPKPGPGAFPKHPEYPMPNYSTRSSG